MATVLRIKGYAFKIYSREADNERPHVHVRNGEGAKVKVWLDTLEPVANRGYHGRELNEILTLTKLHQQELLAKWEEIHGV